MTTLPIDQMIDTDRGTISREIFVSPDFHREELEKLFTRAWLFVGHESQIPSPGDFFVSRMGEESVILCRDTRGAVHVFLNSCRHRGMKVCRYESRQHVVVRVSVSFLELYDGRPVARRAALSRALRGAVGPRAMVADRGA